MTWSCAAASSRVIRYGTSRRRAGSGRCSESASARSGSTSDSSYSTSADHGLALLGQLHDERPRERRFERGGPLLTVEVTCYLEIGKRGSGLGLDGVGRGPGSGDEVELGFAVGPGDNRDEDVDGGVWLEAIRFASQPLA